MTPSHEEKVATKRLVDLSRIYLFDNFHKFSETNKIKIALTILTKAMPTEVEGMNTQNIMVMGEIKKNESTVRYNIGEPVVTNTP